MADELSRAFAFMARGDMVGTRMEASPFGTAVSCPELPLRQDSNYLLVDVTDGSAQDLAHEVESRRLRAVFVRDPQTAPRLEPEFAALGWQLHRGLVMAHHRSPERTTDISIVTAVGEPVLRPVRQRVTLAYPWATPELTEQLLEAKILISERVETHFLAVVVNGEVAAYADLYLGDGVAQVEDVLTLEQHRNRGYASALVLSALQRAEEAGATLVFLAADADDWPRLLYERLGFDVIGSYWKFFA
jgi:GNAT superfamily N-acetyltransferase